MNQGISRRQMLASSAAGAVMAVNPSAKPQRRDRAKPFRYCLNTSTLMGQKLPITKVVDIAAKAGYQGLEPWIRELDEHVKGGATLKDLGKQIRDHGMTVDSAIGFFDWIVDDDGRRAKGLEEARRNMEMVAAIGGTRLAAPPSGATDRTDIDLLKAADRYRALLELGEQFNVVPQAEVWGFSKTLQRLGAAVLVAVESGHPKACVLPDVYHLHKGGSPIQGLSLLSRTATHCFHMNDYPAEPPRETITDAHRVYPGDGVAPLDDILRILRDIGFSGSLSLELFNRDYWAQDAAVVARTGIEKMRAAVRKAIGRP